MATTSMTARATSTPLHLNVIAVQQSQTEREPVTQGFKAHRPSFQPVLQLPRIRRHWLLLLAALLALALAALALDSPSMRHHAANSLSAQSNRAGGAASSSAMSSLSTLTPAVPSAPTAANTTTTTPSAGLHPAPTSTPTPATTANAPSSPSFGLPDPGQWVQQALTAALTALLSGLVAAIQQLLAWASGLHTSSFNFITLTPPQGTYQDTVVVTLWYWVVGITDAALALLTIWGGYNLIVRRAIGAAYASAFELVPRLALAALAANLSLAFVAFFVDANNALCDGVGAVPFPGFDALNGLGQNLAALLLALIYGVVGVLLVLQMLLRIGLLDLLIVTAPLGLLCWALPQTQAWARLWTSTFVATAMVQFLQVVALKLGASLLVEPTPGQLDTAVLTLLVGIADLYLTFKIPSWLRVWALRSVGAASVGGLIDQGVAWVRAAGAVAAAAA